MIIKRLFQTLGCGLILSLAAPSASASEVRAGTRFMVELRDKLEGKKAKRGKKFDARTIETLRADDGRTIPSGAKLRGRVSHADDDKLILRFEEIDTGNGWRPLVATVRAVHGEKNVRDETGSEGEIRSEGGRAKGAAIGAAIVGGIGAAIGAKQGGGKGAAIGAGAGAGTGAAIGAAATGPKDLVLDKGARLELQLDRPFAW